MTDAPNDHPIRSAVDQEILSDLDDFADAVALLTPGDCARLVAFWQTGEPDARAEAHEHARVVAEETDRADLIRSLQGELREWSGDAPRGRTGWGDRWWDPAVDPALDGNQRSAALPALADTALALALQDRLDDTDFDALFGPWSNAMGDGDEEDPATPMSEEPTEIGGEPKPAS
jgi:hypothetical protein